MKDLGSIVNEIETRFIKSIMLYRHLTSDERFELQELKSICSHLELGPEVQPLMTRITNLKRKNELIAKQEYERARNNIEYYMKEHYGSECEFSQGETR